MIQDNLFEIENNIPNHVTLVAVSKTKPLADIEEAYNAGQRIFGENKVQEMVAKYEALPKDIKWHMIGHLQRNKVKYMAHFVDLIHGIDSLRTLKEIDKHAKKHNRIINCLLQVHIATEDTKFGLSFEEINDLTSTIAFQELENIKIVGLMGMASFTNDTNQITAEFTALKDYFDLKKQQVYKNFELTTLSMGMSGDYPLAIACGSTMVRIGSSIFGTRNYFS